MKRVMKSPITLLLVLCLVLCTVGTAAAQVCIEPDTCITGGCGEITPWGSIWYGGPDDASYSNTGWEQRTVNVEVRKEEVEDLKDIMNRIYSSASSKNN
jgi:hypothetical protein